MAFSLPVLADACARLEPVGAIVETAAPESATVRRVASADVVPITVTIRRNENAHRGPSAVVTKSTPAKALPFDSQGA